MKRTCALVLVAGIAAACGGSNDEKQDGLAGGNIPPGDTPTVARHADFDESCLTKTIPDGQMIQALVNLWKFEGMIEFGAKDLVDTQFRGQEVKKLTLYDRVAYRPDSFPIYTDVYVDPSEMIFPLGVVQWGYDRNVSKYRRFEYQNRVTGKVGVPTLVGMKANESLSLILIEYNEARPDPDPDSRRGHLDGLALDIEARRTHVTVQYLGRESISARESRYEDACKLKVSYYDSSRMPLLNTLFEGTLWLAANAGPVKVTGGTTLGVDLLTGESAVKPVGEF
ncbi:hypothetical protein [Cupriavidus sp.]|uniref:hypothetical protein n=1 Tax=Cupriavidus sp. TaxID=1873897 RepID=UPI0031DDD64A